ncbi:alkaline phosphatase family protein [Vibrio gazogenes]|uniref:Type I phosphodiesterase / nucleotide pyrophosphatase n=1 Tax=Vibrio gazogenes DSM 21264 = NBRC 103151 TaxID=1123492 RepID=A0A1M5ELN0_VIBGA|nr:alkaline phosphatase family protein [Vibrio gazogenes]USP12561.1 alkaline phosphatase family protein [Vibrio gazogenes]SHF80139.1 Type I phosphodiesterase / nucleotide pyrophosphatase [Vibrio gazogenes DSM 21264] [Vibrio gazogenes DSM 21264 = NBRC 103151]SJN54054.1 Type I phosphodiesterase / nucleotide pyrophosphatase [Vibrio gazogenes]
MNNKVILVVLDGLNLSVAQQCLGYLNSLTTSQQAMLYPITCELPSLSRPLYECLLTGIRPVESGIVHNHIHRRSHHESVFSLATQQGKTTAAAAYHWFSELYNRSPYNPVEDRVTDDPALNIQHGRFYHWDHYPDEALFLDAEYLRRHYDPDFLLIHPMNIDDAGHQAGLDSAHYRNMARKADMILSDFLPHWIEAGYHILITSDHGMNNDCSHGGTLTEERAVPLFVIGERFSHQPTHIAQTDICGVVCELLGLVHNKPIARGLLQ